MSVNVEEHVWITMSDGCRLGARLWLPGEAQTLPVPAILEYIPYRKRDGTRARDEPMHGYYASNGYAAVRVDMRGSGESEGHLADEYLKLEQDDALEVIAWISQQPWCNGKVGMQGKSWGGFNALQVAARRPPALKAIITTFSTDHRYTDDIHFMGGCVLNDNLWWGSIMLAYQSRPLDPLIVGPDWEKRWLERIDAMPFFPALWLAHQRYDSYWKHGSVCEDYAAVRCPVMAVGGWSDAYTNAVPRMLERLTSPRLGIIGPWGHVYPHDGVPGPAIGFLQEAVRWWDCWLKELDNRIMQEPMLRAYVGDWVAPQGTREHLPGRWVGLNTYPSPNQKPLRFDLQGDLTLGASGVEAREFHLRSPQSHGKAAGEWMGTGCVGEHPTDQRLDDGGALCFDSIALEESISILGAPRFRLNLAADAPVAQLAVRLSDVAPDGTTARVSYQVLNLTHRESHEHPSPLTPHQRFAVDLLLNACGHRFQRGHRLRLSLATGYWPTVWPAPYFATLSISTKDSYLELPLLTGNDAAVHFEPPVHGPRAAITQVHPGVVRRHSQQDHVAGETTYVTEGVGGVFGEGILRFDAVDVELSHSLKRELTIRDSDPLSARSVITQSYQMGREGWRTLVQTRLEMWSDAKHFYLKGSLEAFLNGVAAKRRQWDEVIPRDLV